MFRTHDCNSLRKSDIGRQVTLAGWVNVTRDHGGVIFIDLRDREGLTQVVFRPEENAELAKQAHTLRGEDVVQVSGTVAARLPGTENPNLATGDIEIIPSELRILNRADPLPFPLDAEPHHAGKILRAAAGAAAIQTTAHGRGRGKIFPDRKMFSRRRFARGPATGVHADRH